MMPDHMKKKFYTMIENFDGACKEADVQYFAIAGTLLGAVRHQDMIPWDDDLDIGIMESDVEKLKAVDFSKYNMYSENIGLNNIGKVYFINDMNNGKKMQSVFLDVFVFHENGDRIEYADSGCRKMWPKEYFVNGELFPLKQYNYGNVKIAGPNQHEPYCKRAWGKWKKPMFKIQKLLAYPFDLIKYRYFN